jgi:hypothetical protein
MLGFRGFYPVLFDEPVPQNDMQIEGIPGMGQDADYMTKQVFGEDMEEPV